jgi:hypothetical protein
MVLHVALGLSTGVAEYAEIREAYRSMPRFSYVATTTGHDLQRTLVYQVNYIRGIGLRIEQVQRFHQEKLHTTFWTRDFRQAYTWTQQEPLAGATNLFRTYDVRLKVHDEYPFHKPKLPHLGAGPQIDFIFSPVIQWWELELQPLRGFSMLPDVYLDGRRHRRLAVHAENGQRTVLTYDADRRRLQEIRQEWRRPEGYEVTYRTTYRYRDARTLTPEDVAHPGIVPAFPKMSVEPTAKLGKDRPVPVRAETLEEVADALRDRYGSLETLRDTIEPARGLADDRFHLSINLDRKAGRRLMRRGPFETIVEIGKPHDHGRLWHVTAAKGYLNVSVGREFFPHDALPLGAYLVLRAWNSPQGLDLAREGYQVRSDTWNSRPMKVLWRPVVTGRPSIMGLQNARTIGSEEVWIDATNGLIVRSKRNLYEDSGTTGPSTYEILHRPEPNSKLTASDLEFTPSRVDAVKLVERELRHGGGRSSNQMRFEYWPQ